MDSVVLRVSGEVARPCEFTYDGLSALNEEHQVQDISRLIPKRQGDAVKLAGILQHVQPHPDAKYLGLHSTHDNFHASIPLEPIREAALLIYRLQGRPMTSEQGGPVRFFIPNYAACHTHEIDECANVKYVDHLEFTREKGFDNRPQDEQEHAELHAQEQQSAAGDRAG